MGNGGQGRNRTTDTRIFSPSLRRILNPGQQCTTVKCLFLKDKTIGAICGLLPIVETIYAKFTPNVCGRVIPPRPWASPYIP